MMLARCLMVQGTALGNLGACRRALRLADLVAAAVDVPAIAKLAGL